MVAPASLLSSLSVSTRVQRGPGRRAALSARHDRSVGQKIPRHAHAPRAIHPRSVVGGGVPGFILQRIVPKARPSARAAQRSAGLVARRWPCPGSPSQALLTSPSSTETAAATVPSFQMMTTRPSTLVQARQARSGLDCRRWRGDSTEGSADAWDWSALPLPLPGLQGSRETPRISFSALPTT